MLYMHDQHHLAVVGEEPSFPVDLRLKLFSHVQPVQLNLSVTFLDRPNRDHSELAHSHGGLVRGHGGMLAHGCTHLRQNTDLTYWFQ